MSQILSFWPFDVGWLYLPALVSILVGFAISRYQSRYGSGYFYNPNPEDYFFKSSVLAMVIVCGVNAVLGEGGERWFNLSFAAVCFFWFCKKWN